MSDDDNKYLILNRVAYYEYEVLDTIEAGMKLQGWMVKPFLTRTVSLRGVYVKLFDGQLRTVGLNVKPLKFSAATLNDFSDSDVTLLVHKHQLKKLQAAIAEKGLTIIPLGVSINRGKLKLNIGICRGKKLYDKRETIKQRDIQRAAARNYEE